MPVLDPPTAASMTCFYADASERPPISRCPAGCNGAATYAERRADGVQRFYCEAHGFWRGIDIGKDYLRLLREGERA